MALVPAIGNGDIRSIATLWDGQTDSKASLDVTLNNLQQGDVVEVTLTMAGAGCYQWTSVCRAGDVTFLAGTQGTFTSFNPQDLNTLEDRSWTVLVQSNDVQSITIGLDHTAAPVMTVSTDGKSVIPVPSMANVGYRVSNVTIGACVIAKNYS